MIPILVDEYDSDGYDFSVDDAEEPQPRIPLSFRYY